MGRITPLLKKKRGGRSSEDRRGGASPDSCHPACKVCCRYPGSRPLVSESTTTRADSHRPERGTGIFLLSTYPDVIDRLYAD